MRDMINLSANQMLDDPWVGLFDFFREPQFLLGIIEVSLGLFPTKQFIFSKPFQVSEIVELPLWKEHIKSVESCRWVNIYIYIYIYCLSGKNT